LNGPVKAVLIQLFLCTLWSILISETSVKWVTGLLMFLVFQITILRPAHGNVMVIFNSELLVLKRDNVWQSLH
jgi:hypothetical protein